MLLNGLKDDDLKLKSITYEIHVLKVNYQKLFIKDREVIKRDELSCNSSLEGNEGINTKRNQETSIYTTDEPSKTENLDCKRREGPSKTTDIKRITHLV